MSHRLLLSAGGTGGHIFPALALAEELKNRNCSILFAAGKLSKNAYFSKSPFPYKDISCSKNIVSGFGMNCKGVFESIRIIKEYKPDAVVGFGSYYTLPMLAAAVFLRVPILLHEANSIPGRVNRLFSPMAKKTWISFSEAKSRLSGSIEICKMPLRSQFKRGLVSKQEACAYFGLNPDAPTLLVFGGSQGAKRINDLFAGSVSGLTQFQIIHFTGSKVCEESLSKQYLANGIRAFVRPFESRMDLAWAAADMAVTRAGASSLEEQREFGVPGILIPYPEATDNHQDYNAEDLVKAGLCYKISEKNLSSKTFLDCIQKLNRNEMQDRFYKNCSRDKRSDLSNLIIDWMQNG